MKKKLTALFLSLVMCMTVCAPAFAVETPFSEMTDIATMEDSDGNELKFVLLYGGNNNYTMRYYVNNVLKTVYSFAKGSKLISATQVENASRSANSYTLNVDDYIQTIPSSVAVLPTGITPLATTWKSLGTISYRTCAELGAAPTLTLQYNIADISLETHRLETREGQVISDIVTVVASVLISVFVASYPAATVAAKVVGFIIDFIGAEMIGDVVLDALSEEYQCVVREIDIKTTMNHSAADYPVNYYSGTEYNVVYEDYAITDSNYTEGITTVTSTWKNVDFAEAVWDDSFIYYRFPGANIPG